MSLNRKTGSKFNPAFSFFKKTNFNFFCISTYLPVTRLAIVWKALESAVETAKADKC
jgi:hypothetical protein